MKMRKVLEEMRNYSRLAIIVLLVTVLISAYSLYAQIAGSWQIAPPTYVLLMMSIVAFVLALIGLSETRGWKRYVLSWLPIVSSALVAILLFGAVLLTAFAQSMALERYVTTSTSPDGRYTIDFYYVDHGAAGTFGMRGDLNGPLWATKPIYFERHAVDVLVDWQGEATLVVNGRVLNLAEGERYGY